MVPDRPRAMLSRVTVRVVCLIAFFAAVAMTLPMASVRRSRAKSEWMTPTLVKDIAEVTDDANANMATDMEDEESDDESESAFAVDADMQSNEESLRFQSSESEVASEVESGASVQVFASLSTSAQMQARAVAAMQSFVANTVARHRAYAGANQCVHRSRRLSDSEMVEVGSGARFWNDKVHPYLCAHIVTFLKSVKGQGDVQAGTTDAAAVTAWLGPAVSPHASTWRGRTKNNADTNALNDGAAEAEALKMMRTVRYRLSRNRADPCHVAAISRGATAVARFASANKQPGITIGLETELHFLNVMPATDKPNAVCRFAVSAIDPKWNLYYSMISSDHAVTGNTIVEVIFSPLPLSPSDDTDTGDTYKTLYQMGLYTRNLASGAVVLATNSVLDKGVTPYGYVQMSALATELHARNQGNNGGTALPLGGADNYKVIPQDPTDCGGVLNKGGSKEYRVQPVLRGLDGKPVGDLQTMAKARYTQSNLMLPIAAFATTAFVELADVKLTIWRSSMEAARTAAREYVIANIKGLAALSNENKAEILGMFTAFYSHALFAAVTSYYTIPDPSDLTGKRTLKKYFIDRADWVPSSTEKNFFDVMIKTGLDKLLRNGNTEIVDEMNEFWMSKDFGMLNAVTPDVLALVKPMGNAVCTSTDTVVKKWCESYWRTNTNGAGSYAVEVVRSYAANLDPLDGSPVPTSPTGSDPPAFLRGTGANSDSHVLAVVEVRSPWSPFTAAATSGKADEVNAAIKKITGKIEWTGAADKWPEVK